MAAAVMAEAVVEAIQVAYWAAKAARARARWQAQRFACPATMEAAAASPEGSVAEHCPAEMAGEQVAPGAAETAMAAVVSQVVRTAATDELAVEVAEAVAAAVAAVEVVADQAAAKAAVVVTEEAVTEERAVGEVEGQGQILG